MRIPTAASWRVLVLSLLVVLLLDYYYISVMLVLHVARILVLYVIIIGSMNYYQYDEERALAQWAGVALALRFGRRPS